MDKPLTILTILYFSFCSIGFGQGIKQCVERMAKESKKGNMETAFKNAEKAFNKIKQAESIDKDNLANLKSIGDFYFDSKKYNNAIEVYSFLCEENKKIFGEKSIEYSTSLFSLTRSCEFSKDYEAANTYYLQLISIYGDLLSKTDKEYLYTLDDYARFNLKFKKYIVAKKYFLECLEGYKIVFGENSERVGWTLNNLGNASFWNDEPAEAESYYVAALNIYQIVYSKSHKEYILTLKNLIEVYRSNDDLAKAEPKIEDLYSILSKSEVVNTLEFANFLDNLFLYYLRIGQNEKALVLWEKAYDIRKSLTGEESMEIAKSFYNLGLGCLQEGSADEAKSKLYNAYIIATKLLQLGDVELVKYNEGLAEAYRAVGDYDSALEIYNTLLNTFGDYYKNNPYNNAILNNNLGSFWEDLGHFDRAESSYLYAYSIIEKEKLQSNDYAITSLFNISILYGRMKQYEKAEPYINKAYNLIEKKIQNNLSYFNEKNRVELLDYIKPRLYYLTAYSIEYSKQKPEILKLIVKNNLLFKSLLFDESIKMRNNIDKSDNKELKELYAQMVAKREILAAFYSVTPDVIREKHIDVEKIEQEADSLEKKIAFISVQYKNNITTQNLSYNDLILTLKNNEAVVEFISYYDLDSTGQMNEKNYGALILKHNLSDPIFVAIGTEEEMQHYTYANYINSILSKENDYETYKNTWGKFEKHLNSISEVYVSNEGVFNKINHATIFCPETNKHLNEKFNISLLFSLRDLVNKKESKVNLDNTFLFGYPKYDLEDAKSNDGQGSVKNNLIAQRIVKDGKVIDLPATNEEIKDIENIFKSKKIGIKSFSETLATKNSFLSISNPSIIHIATHGFFVPDDSSNIFLSDIQKQKASYNPYLKCGLLFAGCNPYITEKKKVNNTDTDNGIVTAFDVLNMDLTKTDLVILSACQTGLGESRDGEAMYSLQKAFQIAGAKSVIMSLWTVSDNATQILMTKFYENLLAGKNKKDALKVAQNYLISKTAYKHPYYWGAFVLVGF
jgi:lipopolysaccharide biosynthesis regulator YciM